jgi:hypothetical protein
MRCLSSLVLAAFLSAGSGVVAITPMLRVADPSENACAQTPEAIKPPSVTTPSEKTAIPATVTGIDPVQGVLDLETKVGRVRVEASPQMLQDLQVGDQVELCTVDEEPSENLLQDSIIT